MTRTHQDLHRRLLALAGLAALALAAPAQAALTLKPASVKLAPGASVSVQISGAAGEIRRPFFLHGRKFLPGKGKFNVLNCFRFIKQ